MMNQNSRIGKVAPEKGVVDVVGMASHSYLPGALVTFSSILKSSDERARIRFHIFSDDFTAEDEARVNEVCGRFGCRFPVTVHKPNMDIIKQYCVPYKGSYLTWVRLFLCEFLGYDWIVYVDTDTLWFRDIGELWAMRKPEVPIYWSLDVVSTRNSQLAEKMTWNPSFDPTKYGSGGVLLMNLARFRKDGLIEQVKEFIARYGCPYYADQDILNHFYNKESVVLDPAWNCMIPNRQAINAVVLHCVGIGGMFNGPLRGWNAFNGIWYDFYYRTVLQLQKKPYGLAKKLWWSLYGFFYPRISLLRLLTVTCASHRAEQLEGLQFRAWVYAHRRFSM